MYPTEEDQEGEPPNEGTTDRKEEEYECCYMCGKVPCKWIEYGLPVVEEIKTTFWILQLVKDMLLSATLDKK